MAKKLIADNRPASKEEQQALAKYVGWGGLSGVFPNPATGKFGGGLEKAGERLRDILTPEEYEAAAASTQNAHYTPEHVIRSMWDTVERMGFKGGSVFEPGMGVGHFAGLMPTDIAARSAYEGIEMDHLTAGIANTRQPRKSRSPDMVSRRDFFQAAVALSLAGSGGLKQAAAGQKIRQDDLLRFQPLGQATLLHLTDLHAQLTPIRFREPSVNLGVGEAKDRAPHLTGAAFRDAFGIAAGSPDSHALTSDDFVALPREYGRMGGLDRIATLVGAIRGERGPERVLLLDGGDTWQGSWGALQTRGGDMAACMALLRPDAMTGHFEFTLGQDRVKELAASQTFPFLAGNITDEWKEPVFEAWKIVERGGIRIGIVGQAFPYTPVANPGWLVPDWTFGLQEELVRGHVRAARAAGAEIVVLLSHNGYDTDRKMATRVEGIDILLSGHTHDAMPRPEVVGGTVLVASGCYGKFLSRIDIDVKAGRLAGWRHRLIPVFSDAIEPDPAMAAAIAKVRAPFAADLAREVGRTETLLYRRGNVNGAFDDLICDAMLEQRDAEIALSPGFRWGPTLLPGEAIRAEDIYNSTAITYPECYRTVMTGARLHEIMEDVADNLFNPDPYYQQGGDMVRVGGLSYVFEPAAPMGKRVRGMIATRTGAPIEATRDYIVAGWASVNRGTQGPPIWKVVEDHLKQRGTVRPSNIETVRIVAN